MVDNAGVFVFRPEAFDGDGLVVVPLVAHEWGLLIRRKLQVRSATALDGQHCLAKGKLAESRISRGQIETLQ